MISQQYTWLPTNGIVILMVKHTVFYTDHKPLEYLLSQSDFNKHQIIWLEQLGKLDLEFVYRVGYNNIAADALSIHLTHYPEHADIDADI